MIEIITLTQGGGVIACAFGGDSKTRVTGQNTLSEWRQAEGAERCAMGKFRLWLSKQKSKIQGKPERLWLVASCSVVFVGIAVSLWWLKHIPSVGKGGLLLAMGATLMPLFWEKIGAVGKMSWIAMLFIMLAIEYRAIDKAQNDSDLAQQKSLTTIGDGFKAVIRESSEDFKRTSEQASAQFEATMNRSNLLVNGVRKSIEAQTGGDSYVVVSPAPVGGKDDAEILLLGIIACNTCTDSIPSAHIIMNMTYPIMEPESTICEGQIDPFYYQFSTKKITPSKVGESDYTIRVLARNKPTTEVLAIRFNHGKNIWEYSYRIAREMKRPHYNPKTQLAEGLVANQLEFQPWGSGHVTTADPDRTTVHH